MQVCPHCHAEIDTAVRSEPGLIAWLSGGLLVLFGYLIQAIIFVIKLNPPINIAGAGLAAVSFLAAYRNA